MPALWSETRVAHELLQLAHDLDGEHMPPHREIRARSRTLLRSMQATGGSRVWAARLGLTPWSRSGRRPNGAA